MRLPLCIVLPFLACFTKSEYVIDDSKFIGRRFDGLGAISGGGATSKLLVNYPAQQRNEILDYLFKPKFGASLHMLKVEIGGDSQSTEGTEASHMHESWDESYERGYEWWIMKEAKKRNPSIKLYALPWGFPGWVGQGSGWPYKHPELTALYVTKWILGAKQVHNLTIDYVGIWNEKPYDIVYIKTLRATLDKYNLQSVRIVAADILGWDAWNIVKDMARDPELNKTVDYLGAHYTGTYSSHDAQISGKPLWSSEDYSTVNDNVGAGCWARLLNQNYVQGFMTSTIAWNLISSYYHQLPFPRNGLMNAEQPWSGNYEVRGNVWITAHTSQFVEPGWTYLAHGQGVGMLDLGGSYVTLTCPQRKHLTIVIETMSHDHSVCVRPPVAPYQVRPQTVRLNIGGSFNKIQQLNVWYTKLGFGTNSTTLFKQLAPLKIVNDQVALEVDVDSVYTLTTVDTGVKGSHPDPPAPKTFPLPYKEDFEGYELMSEPYNFAQQVGSFEVGKASDVRYGKVMRQVVFQSPVHWCPAPMIQPLNVIGNGNWGDISTAVDVHIPKVNATKGVFVAARVDHGGCGSLLSLGVYFWVFPGTQHYEVTTDLARTQPVSSGKAYVYQGTWYNLQLVIKGKQAMGFLDRAPLFNLTVPAAPPKGFAAVGADSFGLAEFDNVHIQPTNSSHAG